MPACIIYRGGTVVEAVGERSDLVKRSSFSDLFKGPVDIPDGLLGRNYFFAIELKDILEHTVRGRMRRTEVQRSGRFFNAALRKLYMMFCHFDLKVSDTFKVSDT